jgi:hypothetical protein
VITEKKFALPLDFTHFSYTNFTNSFLKEYNFNLLFAEADPREEMEMFDTCDSTLECNEGKFEQMENLSPIYTTQFSLINFMCQLMFFDRVY